MRILASRASPKVMHGFRRFWAIAEAIKNAASRREATLHASGPDVALES
jgi:hypothetical protein